MGGLPRRATFIKQHLAQGTPTLVVDSGNLFADKPVDQRLMKTTLAKADLILRAYEAMGYEAAVLGEMDMYMGRENLRELFEGRRTSLLSANLVNGDGTPVLSPYKIVQVGRTSVGIVGLTSDSVPARLLEKSFPGCRVNEPLEAAREALLKLRPKVQLIIVLSRLGFSRDVELARQVEGIDLIIGGRDRRWMRTPKLVDDTLVTSAYFEGRAMGWLKLAIHGEINGWIEGKRLKYVQDELEKAEGLAGTPDEAPRGRLRELRDSYADALARTRYDGNMVNLHPRTADDPDMVDMIARYRHELVVSAGKAGSAGSGDTGAGEDRYLGAAACLQCHVGRHRFWRKTRHAAAMGSLTRRGAQADPDCLPCHTTGYEPGRTGTVHSGVQCEACHGTGALHASWPETYPLLGSPPAEICIACHTPEQDDDFLYSRDRKLVCRETP